MGTIVTTLELFHIWEPRACEQDQKMSEEEVLTPTDTTLLLTGNCSSTAVMGAI